jgi:fibronectin-binding autotransporter adhesin
VVQSDSNLGSGRLLFDDGTLLLGAPFVLVTSNKAVTLNSGGGTFEVSFLSTAAFSGPIIDSGALTDFGVGKLILSGMNIYTGGTNIILGTVEVKATRIWGLAPSALIVAPSKLWSVAVGSSLPRRLPSILGAERFWPMPVPPPP